MQKGTDISKAHTQDRIRSEKKSLLMTVSVCEECLGFDGDHDIDCSFDE